VALEPGGEGSGGDLEGGGEVGGGDGVGGWSVQKTVLGQAETIDFSLPKPGFTENSDHSLAVKTRRDNGEVERL